jgi:cyclophilin family peptidyl-prolyl cis-trans isomerase
VYQVNKNYKPHPVSQKLNTQDNYTKDKESNTADERPQNMIKANMTPSDNIAILKTSLGNITLEFFPGAAPKHVNSFLNLSKTGFYDGTIFHRIVKDFVIQGGDPTTKNLTQKERWGTGGPGYTIDAEFNDIPHERGIISMARTGDPNSAGSQFFIVTKDARFLDNQYTVFGNGNSRPNRGPSNKSIFGSTNRFRKSKDSKSYHRAENRYQIGNCFLFAFFIRINYE